MCSENNLQKSNLPLHRVGLIDLTQVSDLVTGKLPTEASQHLFYISIYEQYQHITFGSVSLIDMFINLWALFLNF